MLRCLGALYTARDYRLIALLYRLRLDVMLPGYSAALSALDPDCVALLRYRCILRVPGRGRVLYRTFDRQRVTIDRNDLNLLGRKLDRSAGGQAASVGHSDGSGICRDVVREGRDPGRGDYLHCFRVNGYDIAGLKDGCLDKRELIVLSAGFLC